MRQKTSLILIMLLSVGTPALALNSGERWYHIGDSFGKFKEDPCPGRGFYDDGIKYCNKKSDCYENGVNNCAPQDKLE